MIIGVYNFVLFVDVFSKQDIIICLNIDTQWSQVDFKYYKYDFWLYHIDKDY